MGAVDPAAPASRRGQAPQVFSLAPGADLDGFRSAVRSAMARDLPPERVIWQVGDAPNLFGCTDTNSEAEPLARPLVLPRAVTELIASIVRHREPQRYALLYELIWRISHGERALLEVASDPLVHHLHLMHKAVARDLHKMHAFLRFRRVGEGEGECSIAWFEPEHHILAAAAEFFVDRFRGMRWSILTPDGSAHWDGAALTFGPPGRRSDLPEGDGFEEGWRAYYESTFNPARLNLDAMRAEMPRKYWRNMPETAAIPALVRAAENRSREMVERLPRGSDKRDPVKAVAAMAGREPASLEALNALISAAEPLVPGATRAVLGEGPIGAPIAFVGEQPGDVEDREGRPFVGPAGQLLARAMEEAGIRRGESYVTNAVKHFKFEQRGKHRIHQKPNAAEVAHYRWWLERELAFVGPRLVVALGATAVLALARKTVPITKARGPSAFGGRPYRGFVTVHPAYLLRLPDAEAKAKAYRSFVEDLRAASALAAEAFSLNA